MYNKTQLHPEQAFERHVFHRDMFAHFLRWTYVLKIANIGMNILDFGCGSGNLAEVLYRNRYKAKEYLGLDIRQKTIKSSKEKFKDIEWIDFLTVDLVKDKTNFKPKDGTDWDIISCFEVIEHIGKENVNKFLNNIWNLASSNTILLISTPCYDKKIGAAKNHIINGVVCELTYDEMHDTLIRNGFVIDEVFGTFASQKDYKLKMNNWQMEMFNNLSKYYDINLISNIMAPLFPMESRNCLWRCKKNDKV